MTPARSRARTRPAPHQWLRFRPRLEDLEGRWVPAADVILEWNSVLLQANAVDHSGGPARPPEQGGPTLSARAFAIVSAAMYDAYNSVENIGDPFLVKVDARRNDSADAAVAQAARDTLAALFPSQRAAFDAALTQTLARVPDGPRENRGRDVGRAVAAAVLAARANDGFLDVSNPPYVASGLPGFHDVDPLNPGQPYYGANYGSVTPFALTSGDQFEARRLDDGTPEGRLAFLNSQEYTTAFFEVLILGGDGVTTPTLRTPEQTEIGIYWGYDGARGLGTPPRLYNQIVQTVAIQQGNTVAENARLFALVNIAMHDAGVVAWNAKYDAALWRPVLGIREADRDGNVFTAGVPDWRPLGAPNSNDSREGAINFTPPFPAYTSGHASFGAATFQTLTRFYGTDDITFTFISDEFNGVNRDVDGTVRPIRPRTFTSFSQASEENGQSRIYLGVHWAFDKTEGIRTGNQVANHVFDSILEPRRRGGGGGRAAASAAEADPGTAAGDPYLPTTAVGAGTSVGVAPGLVLTTVSLFLPPADPDPTGVEGGDPAGAPPATGDENGTLFTLPVGGPDRELVGDSLPALRVTGPAADVLSILEQLFPTDPTGVL